MLFTSEHEQLRQSISDFIDKEINPYVDEWEENPPFPAHSIIKKMGPLGWLGINKPEKYGGVGLDYSYNLVLAEELGRIHSLAVAMGIGVHTDMATPALTRFGSDELRQEFLVPAIAGDCLSCIGVSEPQAGSDVAKIKTYAKKDGDDYVINGTKTWITNSTQADWVCLLANTADGPIHKNKSLIIVPMKTKGLSVSEKFDKVGMRASDTAQIFFDNVRVPQRYRIGEEGAGFVYQMQQFQEERMWGTAFQLKAMEKVVADTIEYAADRTIFDKPLLDNQVVHFKLAELQTEIESVRSMLYRAADLFLNGKDVTTLASMAKLKAGRMSLAVVNGCIQYWGGMGFMSETPISRYYRDVRIATIGGGADEIMLRIIAKQMGILPKH